MVWSSIAFCGIELGQFPCLDVEQPKRFETVTGSVAQKTFDPVFSNQICKRRINLVKRTLVQKGQIEFDGQGYRVTDVVDQQLDRWMPAQDDVATGTKIERTVL